MLCSHSKPKTIIFITIAFLVICVSAASEADDKFFVGPKITITTGDGEPAHDIPRIGLNGRYLLKRDLYITSSIDFTEYDFERPYKLLGIGSVDEVDSKVSGIIFGVGAEKDFRLNDQFKPYVAGGMAVALIDADDIVGISPDGHSYNITTDTGTEFIPYLNAGIRWEFWRNLALDLGARLEYHLADWEVTDRFSGRSYNIDDYFQYGGYVGIALSF